MKKTAYILSSLLILSGYSNMFGRGFRVAQIPNGSKLSCNSCHNSGGGSPRNDFGNLIQKSFIVDENGQFNAKWNPLLASLDSDNDGATNGEELQDPFGLWEFTDPETPAPGDENLVTSAGLSDSSPFSTLTINFTNMNPHNGQNFYLRVFDKTKMKEISRTSVTVTTDFVITMDVLLIGHNYNIDFFADQNGNGYDYPTSDHTWRIELDNAAGNDVVDFSHNTNFVDIEWPNLLTINFSNMTPHIGQLLELRVEDDLTSNEVGRTRIEFIPSAEFTLEIPGIEMAKEYTIEIYADLNKNGVYDAPPTDHAWEAKFENTTGDFSVDFSHNTNFKDVGWKYLYTLNFVDMAPHVDQLLEMRVVRNDNSEEVSRTSVIVPGPEFVLSIPQIEMDHNYNVEFYADLNNNGVYDAPTMDHAWRLTFNSTTGNYVQNFSHNANFVDINWDSVTSVEDKDQIPNGFVLNQNYPNPFNPTTSISFQLEKASAVSLNVYNVLGERVASLINQVLSSGLHEINFNAENLQSGTYYYALKTDLTTDVKKMILLK